MPAEESALLSRRTRPAQRWLAAGRPAPVSLVCRFLVAQAAVGAAVGIGYSRRNLPMLAFSIVVALVVCGLAVLVRSGGHAAWLATLTVESALVAVGLFRFAYAGYLGGTLLAIITLGTLLHPATSGAFATAGRAGEPGADPAGIAEPPADLQGSAVSP